MTLKLQKFAPIDRNSPIFEIVDNTGEVLFDISRNDRGGLEIALPKNPSARILALDEVLGLIDEARRLLELEEASP